MVFVWSTVIVSASWSLLITAIGFSPTRNPKDGSTGFSSEIYIEKFQLRSKNKKSEESKPAEDLPEIDDSFSEFDDIKL